MTIRKLKGLTKVQPIPLIGCQKNLAEEYFRCTENDKKRDQRNHGKKGDGQSFPY